jgi:hypothetical protein
MSRASDIKAAWALPPGIKGIPAMGIMGIRQGMNQMGSIRMPQGSMAMNQKTA